MELDLETFLTTLYVMTDDLYVNCVRPQLPHTGGPPPKLCDSEVLCLGLAGQWRAGVPWKTERGLVRYALKHLRPFFPGMTSQSAFNRRLRRLWGAFILIQQTLAQELAQELGEIMDSLPVPVAKGARSFHPGWLAGIARIGKGGNEHFIYGLRLLMTVTPCGLATGWTLGAANIQDRWLAEFLFSCRAGSPSLAGPPGPRNPPRPAPPQEWLGPVASCGPLQEQLILADAGFDGADWLAHWYNAYGARVQTPTPESGPRPRRWFSSLRQVVETVFANLVDDFGLAFPGAHTTWGLLTRVAAKIAAYNLGIAINRHYGRADFAFATLIV